jgi:hypothetical protein
MDQTTRQGHQVMDFRAALLAGLVAGTCTLLILLIAYPLFTGGRPWAVFRFIAAIGLGSSVLPPPSTFDIFAVVTASVIHLTLSVLYSLVLAVTIHRWGIIVGVFGGALFGAALFLINLFTFTSMFDWFYPLRSWSFLLLHIFFGAVAGGLYELFERDY